MIIVSERVFWISLEQTELTKAKEKLLLELPVAYGTQRLAHAADDRRKSDIMNIIVGSFYSIK